MSDFLPWLALALIGVAIASAIGAIAARALFVTCMHVIGAGVCAAAATMLLRAGDGALAFALFAAAWAPVLLLAAMLLSVRAVKSTRQRLPWASIGGALAAAVSLWWPLLELRGSDGAAVARSVAALSFWLAPLVFVAVATCLGALGYGERGALAHRAGP
ncbi:MAG: hypothetical protein R3C30_07250 [Hyphomonadaceae bacterium]